MSPHVGSFVFANSLVVILGPRASLSLEKRKENHPIRYTQVDSMQGHATGSREESRIIVSTVTRSFT